MRAASFHAADLAAAPERATKATRSENSMRVRARPAGPPAAKVRPSGGGIGRGSTPAAESVSDALRRREHPHLSARRRVAALQTISTWALSVVGLYQFGILRRVPEPPLPGLGADAVDASGEA